jgi:hypothetical protein
MSASSGALGSIVATGMIAASGIEQRLIDERL